MLITYRFFAFHSSRVALYWASPAREADCAPTSFVYRKACRFWGDAADAGEHVRGSLRPLGMFESFPSEKMSAIESSLAPR